MSSAVSATPNPVNASQHATQDTPAIANGTTSSSSGAVPAQLPVRSYANATKTATPTHPAGASAPAHNAKPASDNTQMNGTAAQGGSQPANGMNGHASDHTRKTSVVISASGASGSYPNGGPVQNSNSRPAINFGSMGAHGAESQGSAPFAPNNASLPTPASNPRVTSPAHSPSPIPQPAASGGRPPSINATNNGGLNFGAMSADTEMMRGQGNMGPVPAHERRPSSHSMQNEHSNQGVNMSRSPFPASGGSGRGRGAFNPGQQPFMGSPSTGYRQMAGQPPRGPMPPQFGQQGGPPGSPFRGAARMSPAPMHAQPHYQQQHMGANQQMQYGGYPQHMNHQQQAMYGMPNFDPSQGYYQPYYPQNYYGQPPQSPRPGYPTPFTMPPNAQQPPFHPPGTPGAADMNRTGSQTSNRPTSAIGHPQTPAQNPAAPSHTPNASQSSAFQRPKKSSAIKITDASGNAVDFKKSAPSPNPQAQPGTPVIVSTPSNPTPPPRAPSTQHNRTESKTQQDPEKTKNEFVERVKRQAEENKRKEAEEEKAKGGKDASNAKAKERAASEEAAQNKIEKATAEAEEAAAKAASDKKAVDDAAAAKKATEDDEAEKTRKQQEEDERLEREIAEMEAAEKEEEERERAYSEKKAKQKAEQAAKEAERAKQQDEELKRQEREAEAREEARDREREGGAATDADEEKKALFAQLNKHPELGSAPESGADTPASDDTPAEASGESETPAAAPARCGAQKPKPAHLKLETNKQVERAEPTPGMQALKSARFLELKEDAKYPDGFKSPNPALNESRQKGKAYDKDFLLQFQNVFKEKPSVDWDLKVKETLGPSDEPGSARPGSARTPSGAMSRGGSNRPGAGGAFGAMGGAMGSFAGPMGGNARGTTSEQRFAMSNQMPGAPRPGGMAPPMGGRQPSNLGMGAPGAMMSRTNSSFNMAGGIGPGSPRNPSARGGKGSSKRDNPSRRQESDMAAKMPLTANKELAPLEKSSSGWKPTSIGQAASAGPDPSGNMAPDMVQRKVKAALNKMTPEKFDKIADQILEIAAQSKTEQDGRTLRQVIQLTFEKACDEAHWAGMYAKFCHKMLTTMSTDIRDETIKDKNGNPVVGGALFRKYLLNRCQEEFERGWQANLPDKPEGEEEAALLTDDYYIAAAAKRRGLGLIQFIGQLYKLRMLTLRIMHECVMRLLNFEGDPDEATVENLTTLLKAVGASMEEEEQGRGLMVTYFQRIEDSIVKSDALGSRPKFMVMDLIDLRKAGWKGKDSDKGPKTIQQIHEEAEAAQAKAELERQKTQRGGRGGPMPSGRGDARNFSGGGMPPPQDYTRTNVNMDDLRRLQNRGSNPRPTGGSLGPGGGLGPSALSSGRTGSRRGAAGLGPGSTGTSRTNTPPVDKKDEPSTAQNAFSALAALDSSGEAPEETPASPPTARTEPAAQDDDANA
ncbi:Eukaryotic translation initiation factor 4 gamma [Fulvia fulva]|uniref:Eukaryotic translation initiation factor 4 gamma n=1 Tax=Passalora fulva TaxID=5499 RepID=A0A9Q8PCN6_PASFU|nr:Eukaryotic translation initiation factor 4 gamma [Fulvia fulva]UJO20114.1 Eukaryotic translation initiation factor 4 gamma [Fulvia fulva]